MAAMIFEKTIVASSECAETYILVVVVHTWSLSVDVFSDNSLKNTSRCYMYPVAKWKPRNLAACVATFVTRRHRNRTCSTPYNLSATGWWGKLLPVVKLDYDLHF